MLSWLRRNAGWILSLAVVLLPVAIWLLGRDLYTDLETTRGGLRFMAKLTAFSGLAMYAWSLILSARWRFLERLFIGLDKMLRTHYILGGMSILLVFLHPVFLSIASYARSHSAERALKLWLPGDSWMINWGIIAIALMLVVTFITYRINLKHRTFILIHRWFGVLVIPAGLHAFMATGHMTHNDPLRLYMLALLLLALLAFIYHSLVGSIIVRRYRYTVKEVKKLGQGLVEIVLKRGRWPIIFTPGQFAFVSFDDPALDDEAHPYSFSSSYRDSDVRFVVKNLGDHTAQLHKVKVGSAAYLEGPYGNFSYLNSKNRNQVWIAGGIGITPFLSMARGLRNRKRPKVQLFYCTKTKAEAVFLKQLRSIDQSHRNFKVTAICEAEQGFLTAEMVAKMAGGLKGKEFFVCGPPAMMHALKKQLLASGVAESNIHLEEFAFR